jgi:nucleotide-binding universal stress UspA family protein
MQPARKILCPVDFDPSSILALRHAAALARESNGKLYMLHVVPTPPGPEVSLDFNKLEGRARTRLERLARTKVGADADWEVHVRSGPPALEVVRAAEGLGADLIVMTTHGRKGLRHLVLGSVAERVVREAPCPVLTMRPKVAARAARAAGVKRQRSSAGGRRIRRS